MAVIESHLEPPQRDIVTRDRWKVRYNLRLAIGYRDTRAGSNVRCRTVGYRHAIIETGLSFEVVNKRLIRSGSRQRP